MTPDSLTTTMPPATRRPYAIIDADIHESFTSLKDLVPYLSEPWKGLVARGAWKGFTQPFVYWGAGGGDRLDAKPASGTPAGSDYSLMRSQVLDLYDLDFAVLTGYFYPAMFKMQYAFAAALSSAYNDWQIEHWLERDGRLRGSIHVAPQDPEAAAREIDRLGGHPRMAQVMLPIAHMAYGERYYRPIFAAAERNHLVIAMHHTVYVEGSLGMGQYYIERHMLIPQGAMAELISLVCGGVFDRFPSLQVVLLEGGFSWLPHVMWRFDREYKSNHQEIPWVKRNPSEYIRERVKLSTQPTEDIPAETWMRLIDMMGSDRMLVFSTDYPHFDFDAPEEALPRGLPETLRCRILAENARELYGLPQSPR